MDPSSGWISAIPGHQVITSPSATCEAQHRPRCSYCGPPWSEAEAARTILMTLQFFGHGSIFLNLQHLRSASVSPTHLTIDRNEMRHPHFEGGLVLNRLLPKGAWREACLKDLVVALDRPLRTPPRRRWVAQWAEPWTSWRSRRPDARTAAIRVTTASPTAAVRSTGR